MLTEEIKKYIKANLSERRYIHSIGVAQTAELLAKKFNCNIEKAYFAGIVHDMAKEFTKDEMNMKLSEFGAENLIFEYSFELLHGPVASLILKNDFCVNDEEILDAVFYHTTGKENMCLLTKIIYIADFIEPNRNFLNLDKVRVKAFENINEAIIIASDMIISSTLKKGKKLHKDTILARDYLLNEL